MMFSMDNGGERCHVDTRKFGGEDDGFDPAFTGEHELQETIAAAYRRMSRDELCLLLSLRSLPTCGETVELAFRLAVHELSHRTDLSLQRHHTPRFTPPLSTSSSFSEHPNQINNSDNSSNGDRDVDMDAHQPGNISLHVDTSSPRNTNLPVLPPELWADIFEALNDWELSTALGIRTKLRRSRDWAVNGTRLDYTILSGSVKHVTSFLEVYPAEKFTKFGAKCMLRFTYTDLLTFFWTNYRHDFLRVYSEPLLKIPTLASHYGQPKVLTWWLEASSPDLPNSFPREYDEEPLNDASREGHIHVLQWWKSSGLPLRYGLVMDVASSFGHLAVLEWWKNSGLTLNYLHALKGASYRGEVEVLEWWKKSGLRLVYDKEVLVDATKFNRPDVLQWWSSSGLRVEYCVCDIEAALEDAIGGGKEARDWWVRRGFRFDVPVTEWMEYKRL
ncbi:hypothetical protein HOY80DRAFT_946153 [Tuber brumale]|nr:hypothetical protein HOY80DRAFT_946153 [Tuber brumale]